ncbi:MAG: DNA repair protein RadA [Pseudomonadota bacterium]|nr:DNA repair protein RadA [Pseudomonadota bacterium]
MAKVTPIFICQSCEATHRKWVGHCDKCGEWNSVKAFSSPQSVQNGLDGRKGNRIEFQSLEETVIEKPRWESGLSEFDRSCGGGLVPGSAILIGGDPGIGKSTLLLQVLGKLSEKTHCLYVTGEESTDQVRLRADRLGLSKANVLLAAASSIRDLITSLNVEARPNVVVVDSIQTMYLDTIEAGPGSVSQVRACAHELIRIAKNKGFVLLLVGHVTKDGSIAGPRILEHMVDTVMYFEGDRGHNFRILRSIKNRFGPTDEIGVFRMASNGLIEIENPSALFLSQRKLDINGVAVFAGIEGSRPLLVEIQALVSASTHANPRRSVVGWDSARLAMILAVLEARCGLSLAGHEVYLNVAGGLKINEPAADLAVAAALVSSACDKPVPSNAVIFGEVGLSGEIRPVRQSHLRIKEANKLGFDMVMQPSEEEQPLDPETGSIKLRTFSHVYEFVAGVTGEDATIKGLKSTTAAKL